ncbi:MAG: DNA-binding transcriptional LysR family regulator, partial [Gammaproteobacteria bacterium]
MDLELLRTFLEVERLRHFGNAAKALHLTQAAVSARIKLLEGTLGVKLFDRLRRDIRLTPEGTRLIPHANSMIANWRKARQEVSAGGASNQFSIAGSIRVWDVLVQNWVPQLQVHMPDVSLIAHSQSPDILTRQVLDGVLDVAVLLEPAHIE